MAAKKKGIMDLRQLLQLKIKGLSNRKIEQILDMHRNTINGYVRFFLMHKRRTTRLCMKRRMKNSPACLPRRILWTPGARQAHTLLSYHRPQRGVDEKEKKERSKGEIAGVGEFHSSRPTAFLYEALLRRQTVWPNKPKPHHEKTTQIRLEKTFPGLLQMKYTDVTLVWESKPIVLTESVLGYPKTLSVMYNFIIEIRT